MKNKVLLFALTLSISLTAFAQKKANGTVYSEHPAIQVVEEFNKAWLSGDKEKMASYLTEDFKSYNGTSHKPSTNEWDSERYLASSMRYYDELDYFSAEAYPGSYPDAVEYKKDNKEKEVDVQTWDLIKGVHKTTGVKIDAPSHSLYTITKDNKIKRIIDYSNTRVIDEIISSFSNRTNGTIYNHHDNINTVRKAMYAFEKGDLDKYLSFYGDEATFYDINDDIEISRNTEEIKPIREEFLKAFEIKNVEIFGYPDYLEYEMGNGREVLSWWKLQLIRKSDKKAITLMMHISQGFDEDGKIISEVIYYGSKLLTE
ncbi:nuclear transport factor 2 family protein [Aurantibacter crassamenti]|uniref:nuclear transport factor 2 family protein n=1 Tax=Aurantibacter crassamenti TaxID=1837375 RepID=UPI001939E675|nr:nuclear transport factor 2 family protein [Aurantibacter crassamenti]MBM1107662.1 nuclear transport factor 2 family protein [Aurantibacter crassamenti]